jgi:hypothetical protein
MNKPEWNRRDFIVKPLVWAGAARMLAGTNLLSETEAFAISIPLPSIRTAATKRWLEASSGTGHPRQGCHFHQAGNPG